MRISDWSSDVCSSDLLAGLEPGARGGALASWTVPVAAAVIGDPPVPAVGTGLDVTAERGGAAMLDRRHDLELMQAQMSDMGGAVGWPGSAEDVGDQRRLRMSCATKEIGRAHV